MTRDDFSRELAAQLERAERQGRQHAEINAGELHRAVGGYPPNDGETHRMPLCCSVRMIRACVATLGRRNPYRSAAMTALQTSIKSAESKP